jgi:hypothetical protein
LTVFPSSRAVFFQFSSHNQTFAIPLSAGLLWHVSCGVSYYESMNRVVSAAKTSCSYERRSNMLGTILIVLLILMLLGALPTWPHSREWGYYPSGGLGLILLILIILVLMGLL